MIQEEYFLLLQDHILLQDTRRKILLLLLQLIDQIIKRFQIQINRQKLPQNLRFQKFQEEFHQVDQLFLQD